MEGTSSTVAHSELHRQPLRHHVPWPWRRSYTRRGMHVVCLQHCLRVVSVCQETDKNWLLACKHRCNRPRRRSTEDRKRHKHSDHASTLTDKPQSEKTGRIGAMLGRASKYRAGHRQVHTTASDTASSKPTPATNQHTTHPGTSGTCLRTPARLKEANGDTYRKGRFLGRCPQAKLSTMLR